jgi:2-dehydro-3-deoxyphosphogluconate aldolase/(4S)-4-hydroxy-2-oxoglutarate aldolase
MSSQQNIQDFLRRSPVMPVVTLDDASVAADLAQALLRGGIRTIEVTLRTPVALRAIELIARSVPEIAVGAGTVLNVADLRAAERAGAVFAISPGSTPALLEAGAQSSIPYLPAVATASELMLGLSADYRCFKFFPAAVAGGVAGLKAFAGPFPDARFCPTGGISIDTAPSYLALRNVLCIGGSWLTPGEAVAARDWAKIESLAREAVALRAKDA